VAAPQGLGRFHCRWQGLFCFWPLPSGAKRRHAVERRRETSKFASEANSRETASRCWRCKPVRIRSTTPSLRNAYRVTWLSPVRGSSSAARVVSNYHSRGAQNGASQRSAIKQPIHCIASACRPADTGPLNAAGYGLVALIRCIRTPSPGLSRG
jgi:hypothetical protein